MADKRKRYKKQTQRTFIPLDFQASDLKEYRRLRKNSLAKVKRVKDKFGKDLSNDIPIPEFNDFVDRQDFDYWKMQMASFTDVSNLNYQYERNQYGIVASKEQLRKAEEWTKKSQEWTDKLYEMVKDKGFITDKKNTSTIGQHMQKMGKPNLGGIIRPVDFNFDAINSYDRLEEKMESLKKRATGDKWFHDRNEVMKENFIKVLEFSFNSDADDVIEMIENMPADDFFEMTLMFQEVSFRYYSSTQILETADDDNLENLRSYFNAYNRGMIDLSLKFIK